MAFSQVSLNISQTSLGALRRMLSTSSMRAPQHLHRAAFSSPAPAHTRLLSPSRVHRCTRHVHHAPPRRPRARLVPALQMQADGEPLGNELKVNTETTRKIATMPEVGDDGLPVIEEDDIDEQFVRGSGPGGQKINKTASCVVLKHIPTGVTVKCQESRSQMKNRQLARKILQKKLDEMIRGEESQAVRELARARARKAKRRRKAVKKHFKSRRDKAIMDSRMADY